MRAQIYILSAIITLAVILIMAPAALAYHASGELVCGDCHTMHKTDGSGGAVTVGDMLLPAGSESCLRCHDESHAFVEPTDSPWVLDSAGQIGAGGAPAGGDFSLCYDDDAENTGEGHTLGFAAAAPGDSTVADMTLECYTCHEPHGSSNYRMLKGTVDGVSVTVTGTECDDYEILTAAANNSGITADADSHNAYDLTLEEWCSGCHNTIHDDDNTGTQDTHVTDIISTTIPAGTDYGDNTALAYADSADVGAEFPMAETTDTATATTDTDYMTCLTCHYAHGGAYDDGLRFDPASASGTACAKCHTQA